MRAIDTLLYIGSNNRQQTLHSRDPIPSSPWTLSEVLRDTKDLKHGSQAVLEIVISPEPLLPTKHE